MVKFANTAPCMYSDLKCVPIVAKQIKRVKMIITEEHLIKLKEPLQLKWRVKSLLPDNVKPNQMILVAYVDARQVQDRFDTVLGAANWQDDYFECKNKQFCKIGVKIGNEWIWKGDSGSESFLDASKGETSDSFKRAAVHWGINRDSYELGEITIKCKMFGDNPVPVDQSGNKLSGPLLLAECKRISSLQDSELIFDRMATPTKSIEATPTDKRKRTPRKPKTILP
jgi:hypothetical protein